MVGDHEVTRTIFHTGVRAVCKSQRGILLDEVTGVFLHTADSTLCIKLLCQAFAFHIDSRSREAGVTRPVQILVFRVNRGISPTLPVGSHTSTSTESDVHLPAVTVGASPVGRSGGLYRQYGLHVAIADVVAIQLFHLAHRCNLCTGGRPQTTEFRHQVEFARADDVFHGSQRISLGHALRLLAIVTGVEQIGTCQDGLASILGNLTIIGL